MKQVIIFALTASLFGCASAPPPAPGTALGDMSAEQHHEEAGEHDAMAADHEKQASTAQKAPQSAAHKKEAGEHSDVAEQHEAAK